MTDGARTEIFARPARDPDAARGAEPRAQWALAALLGALFLGNVDVAVANIAGPSIRAGLHASDGELELVVSGYTLAYAALLVTSARLGEARGYRRMFLAGLAGFTVASLACGVAPSAPLLVIARVVAGASAALMAAQVLTGIQLGFTGRARARALGLYSLVLSAGAVAGQSLGGLLISADLLGTAAFAAWERRAARPMLPARLFRSAAFSAGNIAIFLINASLSGVIFLMPQFQQVVDGQDPLGSGLRLLPWGIAPFLVGPRAGALADKVGERVLVVTGALVQAAGIAWIAAVAGPDTSYLALVTPMTLVGVGLALSIPAVTRSVTSTVPPADIGTASAAFSTMRQLGGAFGVAVLGAAFAATGGYATPAAFTSGFTTAFGVSAGLALAGAAVGTVLAGHRGRPSPARSEERRVGKECRP